MTSIEFTVYGQAQPGGSKKAYVRGGHASVVDANPKAKPWKHQVAQVAGETMDGRPMLDGPLSVVFQFVTPRPKSHTKRDGSLSALGRRTPYPTTRPDLLKLARLVEDAMTSVVYPDDSLIVSEMLLKRYGPAACVHVSVKTMPAEEVN